eukprot:5696313-Pleurochrysis_carterae.AAC.4
MQALRCEPTDKRDDCAALAQQGKCREDPQRMAQAIAATLLKTHTQAQCELRARLGDWKLWQTSCFRARMRLCKERGGREARLPRRRMCCFPFRVRAVILPKRAQPSLTTRVVAYFTLTCVALPPNIGDVTPCVRRSASRPARRKTSTASCPHSGAAARAC